MAEGVIHRRRVQHRHAQTGLLTRFDERLKRFAEFRRGHDDHVCAAGPFGQAAGRDSRHCFGLEQAILERNDVTSRRAVGSEAQFPIGNGISGQGLGLFGVGHIPDGEVSRLEPPRRQLDSKSACLAVEFQGRIACDQGDAGKSPRPNPAGRNPRARPCRPAR